MLYLDNYPELKRSGVECTMDEYNSLIKPKLPYVHQFLVAVCNTSERYFNERDIHNYILVTFIHNDGTTQYLSPICCYTEKLIIDLYVTLILRYNSSGVPTISELSIACDILRYFLSIRYTRFSLDNDISSVDIASCFDTCLRNEVKFRGWVDALLVLDSNVNNMFPIAYYFYKIYRTSELDLDYRSIRSILFDDPYVESQKVTFVEAINLLFGSKEPLEAFDDNIFSDLFRITSSKELSPRFYIDKDIITDLNNVHDVQSYNALVDKYSERYKLRVPVTYLLAFELYRRFVLDNGVCTGINYWYHCDFGDIVGMLPDNYYRKDFTYIGKPRTIKLGNDCVVIPECIHTVLRPTVNHSYYECLVDLPSDLIKLVDDYYDIIVNERMNASSMDTVFSLLDAIASCDIHLLDTVLQCMLFKHEMSSVLGLTCVFKSKYEYKYHSKQFFGGDNLYACNYILVSRVKDLSDEDKLNYINDHIRNYNKVCAELKHEPIYDKHCRRKAELLGNLYKLKRNLPSMAAFVVGVLVDKGTTVILIGIAIIAILFILLNNVNVAVLSEKIYRIKHKQKK